MDGQKLLHSGSFEEHLVRASSKYLFSGLLLFWTPSDPQKIFPELEVSPSYDKLASTSSTNTRQGGIQAALTDGIKRKARSWHQS
jgi:hypothetical protein